MAIMALAFACSACSSDSSIPHTTTVAMSQQASKTSSDWITSSQKHNNSGIGMRYRIEGDIAVGRPVTVYLEFSGAKSADAFVSVDPAAGLLANIGEGMQKSGALYQLALPKGETTARSMTFTPTAEGEHFIGFQLSQNGQDSAAGIMLRVGTKNRENASLGKSVTTKGGEKLIVMPAK